MTLFLQASHRSFLFRRQHLGFHPIDSELLRHALRRQPRVAGNHHDGDPFRLERTQRFGRGRLDRVGYGDAAGGMAIDGDDDSRCLTKTTHLDTVAIHSTNHSLSRKGPHIGRFSDRYAALFSGGNDGGSQRMFTGPLDRSRHGQHVLFALHGNDLRLSLCQGAGLVEHQCVDFREELERLGVLDQDSCRRSFASGHHDRHRCGQSERAGTGDDQHGDSVNQRVRQARLGTN